MRKGSFCILYEFFPGGATKIVLEGKMKDRIGEELLQEAVMIGKTRTEKDPW